MPKTKTGPDKFGVEHSIAAVCGKSPCDAKAAAKKFQETRVRDKPLGE